MGRKQFASGEERKSFIVNQIEAMTEDGRIRRRTQHIDLNAQLGQGCKVEPDPPDPFAKKKKVR